MRSSPRLAVAVAVAVALTLAAACRAAPSREQGPQSLWRTGAGGEHAGYLARAALSPDAILYDGVLHDAATGAMRWRVDPAAGIALHGTDLADPLHWVVRGDDDTLVAIARLDAATGTPTTPLPITDAHGEVRLQTTSFGLTYAPDTVLYSSRHGLVAIDAATARVRWSDASVPDRTMTVVGELVVLEDYRALDLATGAERFPAVSEGMCCTTMGTPDGRHVYIRGIRGALHLDRSGRVARTLIGELQAVSDRWVVTDDHTALRVYAHDASSDPVHVIPRSGDRDYFGAVAIEGDDLYYFQGANDTLWRHRLGDGTRRVITRVHAKGAITTEGYASAGAHLSAPPRIAPPYVYVLDWYLSAYRVP